MSKMDQRVMLTKRLLKESLIKLLKEKSIYKITIRELCDVAGINRSTFYKYYESQFDLLSEMETEFLNSIYDKILLYKNIDTSNSIEIILMILMTLEENVEFSRLLINNNIDVDFPKKLIYSPQIQQHLIKTLSSSYSKEKIEHVSTFITFGGYYMIQEWINKDSRESAKEIAKLFNSFFVKLLV